jgi:hypothetical protein
VNSTTKAVRIHGAADRVRSRHVRLSRRAHRKAPDGADALAGEDVEGFAVGAIAGVFVSFVAL